MAIAIIEFGNALFWIGIGLTVFLTIPLTLLWMVIKLRQRD